MIELMAYSIYDDKYEWLSKRIFRWILIELETSPSLLESCDLNKR